ncbi:putative ABC transporter ATP-binding protein YbhF [Planctomycetes bacterium Pan216]|uniref:Putative ABC transporter ATP-binding protein YbhF n=1 Tax=Kolteria novifilia TaxID=2527975 RepID=A0A518AYC0_9BACT|nr:putative ABC transporter ATP-binding protein YbhF [Planctomycetes bacterium Pan216]
MPVIEVDNLCKTYRVVQRSEEGLLASFRGLFRRRYKSVQAVQRISFEIEPGEMVAFLGPNGAGKTTTLKMLAGLIHPTSGSAQVLGFTPSERSNEYRRRFALVMGQKNQLWWDLPARESFRLHREIYTIPTSQFESVVGELSDLLSLGDLVDQPVRELSLGERMKMELVAALLHSPRVLFLDEPTIGLDVVAQTQLRDFLRRYNRRHEVTVLLTSHYMKDVESLCERAIVINHGKIVHDGSLAAILNRFSQHKILKLQFLEDAPEEVGRYGDLLEVRGPVARLRVDRAEIATTLAAILDRHRLEDITVEEVPMEEVIAEVFRSGEFQAVSPDETVASSATSS